MAIEHYNYSNNFEEQMYFQSKLAVLLNEQTLPSHPPDTPAAKDIQEGVTSVEPESSADSPPQVEVIQSPPRDIGLSVQ